MSNPDQSSRRFPNEPIVQIVVPILEAELVETFILNQIHFQTVIAGKAARVVTAPESSRTFCRIVSETTAKRRNRL